jgi:hypothetical protein
MPSTSRPHRAPHVAEVEHEQRHVLAHDPAQADARSVAECASTPPPSRRRPSRRPARARACRAARARSRSGRRRCRPGTCAAARRRSMTCAKWCSPAALERKHARLRLAERAVATRPAARTPSRPGRASRSTGLERVGLDDRAVDLVRGRRTGCASRGTRAARAFGLEQAPVREADRLRGRERRAAPRARGSGSPRAARPSRARTASRCRSAPRPRARRGRASWTTCAAALPAAASRSNPSSCALRRASSSFCACGRSETSPRKRCQPPVGVSASEIESPAVSRSSRTRPGARRSTNYRDRRAGTNTAWRPCALAALEPGRQAATGRRSP